jgi:hypothetical protein
MKYKALLGGICAALLLWGGAGCQNVFTYSPLKFLQRDPSNLPAEQKVAWAEDALSSGDPQAMEDAYQALQEEADAYDDPELTYLAARLALELSGVPQLLFDILDESIDLAGTDPNAALEDFYEDIDTDYLLEVAGYMQAIDDHGDLDMVSGTDLLLGAGSLFFQAVEENDGDVDALMGADVQPAYDFAEAAQGLFDPEDSTYTYLGDLLDYFVTEHGVTP